MENAASTINYIYSHVFKFTLSIGHCLSLSVEFLGLLKQEIAY